MEENNSTTTTTSIASTTRANSMSASTSTNLRGSLPLLEGLPLPGSEAHDRLLQYDASELTGDCELLDVVDACRGTGVSREYIGVFKPYDGECSGEFVDGLPIYWNENKKIYMYPIDIYPGDWSIRALRGLVRWRIAKFKTFGDKETCRREEANIFQIDFAADGQPYNYYPTISCFDEFATDFSGFKVSTITVICKDIVVSAPSPDPGPDGKVTPAGDGGGAFDNLGLIIGIAAAVILVLVGAFFYFKKRNGSGMDNSERKRKKAAEKQAKEEAKLAAKKEAEEEKKAKEEAKLEAKRKEEEEKGRKKWEKLSDTSTEKTSSKLSKDGPPEIIPIPTRAVQPPSPLPLSRKMSTDPPARITTGSTGPDDDGIPDDIQQMVSDLDNLLDEELKNSVVPPKKPRGRTRSLERNKASSFDADRKNDHGRSRSLERARATALDYFDRSADAMANVYDGFKKKAKSLHDKKGDYNDNDSIDSSIDDFGEDRPSTSRSRGRSLERAGSDDRRERVERSVERATADSYSRDRARSRSVERGRARDFADGDRGHGRSRSKERSRADDYASKGRGRSKDRSAASDFPSSGDRSRSAERSRANDYSSRDRSRSAERSKASDYASRGRSRSAERSKANDYASRDRSRSAERSKANDYSSRGRSRSKERSAATDHAAHPLRDSGRSRSKERSNSTDYLRDRARARSRSAERNKADDYATRDRGRSRSKERSQSDKYAKNRDRSRSIERRRSLEPAGSTLKADQQPQRKASRDGWGVPGSSQVTPNGDDGMIGRSKSGGKTLDASKVNETITKNPDGSILVSKRRRREDGAMVTTKTKYANIALARKHGVDV